MTWTTTHWALRLDLGIRYTYSAPWRTREIGIRSRAHMYYNLLCAIVTWIWTGVCPQCINFLWQRHDTYFPWGIWKGLLMDNFDKNFNFFNFFASYWTFRLKYQCSILQMIHAVFWYNLSCTSDLPFLHVDFIPCSKIVKELLENLAIKLLKAELLNFWKVCQELLIVKHIIRRCTCTSLMALISSLLV